MKKFLLAAAAVAAMSFGANAADLYATGDFEASNWNPGEPAVFDVVDGGYSLDIESVSILKVSTVMGSWDEFNAGALTLAANPSEPGTYELTPGDANIVMPWTGHWTVFVTSDLAKITLTTDTPAPTGYTKIYLRGGMNGWGVSEDYEMQTTDGVTYTIKGVEIGDNEFKIADDSWSKVNYGAGAPVLLEDEVYLDYDGGNITIDWEGEEAVPVDMVFDVETHGLVITASAGAALNTVISDNAAAVYYTIQGVRVANPTAGNLYIKVCGDKASKVLVK